MAGARRSGEWTDPGSRARSSIAPPAARGLEPSEAPSDRGYGDSSDWGSLVADLAPSSDAPVWRVHDRTHLEFAVDYVLDGSSKETRCEWEAYFFVPASLRIDESSYAKTDIYTDLRSYIRYTVPDLPFGDLTAAPLDALAEAVSRRDEDRIIRELRLFACQVRGSGLAALRAIEHALDDGDGDQRSRGLAAAARITADAGHVAAAFREALALLEGPSSTLQTAARWTDEDVSRVIEMLLGSLVVRLRKARAPKKLIQSVTAGAVAEARYRRDRELDGVGKAGATKREVEHLEYRRHVLKRFTSSVLWLQPKIREGAKWALQAFYAVAAGVAMAFAVGAALLNGPNFDRENMWMWITIAIVAYMGKDRIKAVLQSVFSGYVSRRFPDRRWRIRDRDQQIGVVDEQSSFVKFTDVPERALEERLSTRDHPLEGAARPERVLWHKKTVTLRSDRIDDDRFGAVTEIFRLDLRRWLAHTDDPKRRIVFADPDEGRICSSMAPRVYNIGVVYRLRRGAETEAPWRRVRVVVTRKGIRRIDCVTV